jgi:hypothetical protein
MVRRNDIYGFENLSAMKVLEHLEKSLSIKFEKRDSSYRGLYYLSGQSQSHGFMLYTNRIGDNYLRPEYSECNTLLIVSDLQNMDEIKKVLYDTFGAQIVLLKSKIYSSDSSSNES